MPVSLPLRAKKPNSRASRVDAARRGTERVMPGVNPAAAASRAGSANRDDPAPIASRSRKPRRPGIRRRSLLLRRRSHRNHRAHPRSGGSRHRIRAIRHRSPPITRTCRHFCCAPFAPEFDEVQLPAECRLRNEATALGPTPGEYLPPTRVPIWRVPRLTNASPCARLVRLSFRPASKPPCWPPCAT